MSLLNQLERPSLIPRTDTGPAARDLPAINRQFILTLIQFALLTIVRIFNV